MSGLKLVRGAVKNLDDVDIPLVRIIQIMMSTTVQVNVRNRHIFFGQILVINPLKFNDLQYVGSNPLKWPICMFTHNKKSLHINSQNAYKFPR